MISISMKYYNYEVRKMNIKLKIYRRKEFVDFLADTKNVLIDRDKSTRFDKIEILSATGTITPGFVINTESEKVNVNSEADKSCSYIVKKTITVMTESGIQTIEMILIYDGFTVSKTIKDKADIKNKEEVLVYSIEHLQEFLDNCKNTSYKALLNNSVTHELTNEIVYCNEPNLQLEFGSEHTEMCITEERNILLNTVMETEAKFNYNSNHRLLLIIKQTEIMESLNNKKIKNKYLILVNSYGILK